MPSSLKEATMGSTAGNGFEDAESTETEMAEDEIVEILARLPVKSLLRFKCVSKLWYSLILSPNFIAMHSAYSHREKQVTLLCYLATHTGRVSFLFGDVRKKLPNRDCSKRVQILGCFNGVVCLSLLLHPGSYALWNPATRQFRKLSAIIDDDWTLYPKKGWYGSGFCFDSVANAFKVALVKLTGTEEGEPRAQVNIFSTATNSWTEEKDIALPYRIIRGGFIHSATCVNRYMHWHVANFNRDSNLDESYILSYDMIDKAFKRIEMPCLPVRCQVNVAGFKGSLAVLVHRRSGSNVFYTGVDVWVLNHCGGANQSWSKLQTCRPSIKVKSADGFFVKDNVDLVLLCEYPTGSLYSYNLETGETNEFGRIKTSFMRTFMYRETLASLY